MAKPKIQVKSRGSYELTNYTVGELEIFVVDPSKKDNPLSPLLYMRRHLFSVIGDLLLAEFNFTVSRKVVEKYQQTASLVVLEITDLDYETVVQALKLLFEHELDCEIASDEETPPEPRALPKFLSRFRRGHS